MRVLTFSLLASLAAAAQAQAAPAPPTADPVKEKKICRSEVPVGSIMARRTCLTKAQWSALDGKRADGAEKAIDYVRARANAGLPVAQ